VPVTPRLRSALLIGVAGVLAAVSVWAVYSLLFTHQEREVALPRDDASPEKVVAAYIDALNAHDCETASRLEAKGADIAKGWCTDVSELSYVKMSKPYREKPQWSGHAANQQVMNVGVTFSLDWRWLRNDASMPEGPTTWGYLLERASDDAPWRIADQGVG
jgi:hypothetical protein